MEIKDLVNQENDVAVQTVLVISKQDAALQTAIDALNHLSHINRIEFESFGRKYGIDNNLLVQIRDLQDRLTKARLGRY